MKEYVVFNSDIFSGNLEDEYRSYLKGMGEECEGDIDEDAMNDWAYDTQQMYWDDMMEAARRIKGHCVVTGTFQSWMGPQACGQVCKGLANTISSSLLDESTFKIMFDTKGNLKIFEYHHDSPCIPNEYEIRVLTQKGEQYYGRHCNDDRRSYCEALMKSPYSKKLKPEDFML